MGDGADWESKGQDSRTGSVAAGSVTSNGTVSTFSPFTFGSLSSAVNPLPIELINFDATYIEGKGTHLSWSVFQCDVINEYMPERSENNFNEFHTIYPGFYSGRKAL